MNRPYGKEHVWAENSVFGRTVRLYYHVEDPNSDRVHVAQELLMTSGDHLGVASGPFWEIDRATAQALMDALWEQCGLRPSKGTGSAGAMAATQAHLKDLQRLVFKETP